MPSTKIQMKIIETIKENQPNVLSIGGIQKRVGCSTGSVKATVEFLEKLGHLEIQKVNDYFTVIKWTGA